VRALVVGHHAPQRNVRGDTVDNLLLPESLRPRRWFPHKPCTGAPPHPDHPAVLTRMFLGRARMARYFAAISKAPSMPHSRLADEGLIVAMVLIITTATPCALMAGSHGARHLHGADDLVW